MFSIAVLLFMILMSGQHPYKARNRRSPLENLAARAFPYHTDGTADEDAPTGYRQRESWSHLSPGLRGAFVAALGKTKASKPSLDVWFSLLEEYESMLTDPERTFDSRVGYDLNPAPFSLHRE
jgi:DNA-binding helix-hairpin-helix protein with protein kinase domain